MNLRRCEHGVYIPAWEPDATTSSYCTGCVTPTAGAAPIAARLHFCEHDVVIPEWPAVIVALRCPECFPECPPDVPEAEHGDYVAFGFARTIKGVVRRRGFHSVIKDADEPPPKIEPGTEPNDILADCRAHLLSKREVLTRVAEQGLATLGWTSPAMRAYVRTLLENYLIDQRVRKSEWHVQHGKASLTGTNKKAEEYEVPLTATSSNMAGGSLEYALGLNHPALTTPINTLRQIDAERALRRLTPAERSAIEARYGAERGWVDVAAVLDTTTRTAQRRVRAAEDRLREVLA